MYIKKVAIIGGGLGGLITAIQLARANIGCTVIEKNHYPFHRVCGEYISNEALPFLKSNELLPDLALPKINNFQLSSVNGKSATMHLDLGGFGVSRYYFDSFLYQKAESLGVSFLLGTTAEDISFSNEKFSIATNKGIIEADLAIGAFGKRSRLDLKLNRQFTKKKSPYVAVKYHIKTDFPADFIALHNFEGGYCGVNNVENGITNLCYLANREYFRLHGNIRDFESHILYKNPLLKYIFTNSDFIFNKPFTINEISFVAKTPVETHILMTGDAAGMIAPLCGNGMAMAIHSSKLLSDAIIECNKGKSFSRKSLESYYFHEWNRKFARRIQWGLYMQKLFGNHFMSSLSVNLALHCKPIVKILIANSHGKPF